MGKLTEQKANKDVVIKQEKLDTAWGGKITSFKGTIS
jgi:hypothetical protein